MMRTSRRVVWALASIVGLLSCQIGFAEEDGELHRAVLQDDLEAVATLLKSGADVNTPNAQGNSPIHLCKSADMAAQLLKSGADPKLVDRDGFTAMQRAALQDRETVVNAMIAAGAPADLLTASLMGMTQLAQQLATAHPEFITDGFPYPPSKTRRHDPTMLEMAARSGNLELVKFYVEMGAPLEHKDLSSDSTPLSLAAWNGHAEVVRYLVAKGANPNPEFGEHAIGLLGLLAQSDTNEEVRAILETAWTQLSEQEQATFNPPRF